MAGRKIIAKLSSAKTIILPKGSGYTAQSLGLVTAGKRYVFCNTHNADGSGNHILEVGASKYTDLGKKIWSGHVNGGTYCKANGLCYTTTYGGGNATKRIKAWDPKNKWKNVYTIDLPVYATGIAYDPITTDFYISINDLFYVFPYSAFQKTGTYKGSYQKWTKSYKDFQNQDIGGYGGIVMCCKSLDVNHSSNGYYTSYIDCYKAKDGKYIGSWQTQGECESIAVDGGGNIHVLYAGHGGRKLCRMSQNMSQLKNYMATTPTATPKKVSESELRNKIVKKATYYADKKSKGKHFWDACNSNPTDWCAMFVWTVFKECGMSDIMYTKGTWLVKNCRTWLSKNATQVTAKNAKPGDIVIFGNDTHIEILGKTSGSNVLTIGGNVGYYAGASTYNNSWTEGPRYYGSNPTYIFSPNYSKTKASTGSTSTVQEEVVTKTLEVSVDKLYSSENYGYLQSDQEKKDAEARNAISSQIAQIQQIQKTYAAIPDTGQNIDIVLQGVNLTDTKKPKTKIDSEAHGPSLPVALNPIEAPFIQLTIGGYEFGVKSAKDTNYITGLNVIRTNGSMNEYTINLVHQISPGRNPNFIDELLAANSYEKIKIRYGDAMSNVIFEDNSALLIGSSVNFDFAGYCITYEIKATSSVISTATHKLTYPAKTAKGSTIIRDLLTDASTGLGDIYPNMLNANYVSQNSLIPENDKVITVEAVSNVNPLSYLKTIVATMQSTTSDTSNYYLVLGDDDFKIYEIDSLNLSYDSSLYEVNINYPDDNQVYSFNCNTNFTWPLAYDFNGNLSSYNYTLDHNGIIDASYSRNPNLLDFVSSQQTDISNNWWTNVTEFPITATLECRGLLSPLLLMTYIKINCLYYGQQRLTSGVYIVTGQQDILTGSGYRTILSLLRVAGPKQQLTVDGRVRT